MCGGGGAVVKRGGEGDHGRLSEPPTGQHHRPPAHILWPRRLRGPQEAMLHIGYPGGDVAGRGVGCGGEGHTPNFPLSGTCLLKEVCRKPLFGVWVKGCGGV